MTFSVSTAVKTAALAGALGVLGVAASTTGAAAQYLTTRCYGDHCRVIRCDEDGDCVTIRHFRRDGWDNGWRNEDWRRHHERDGWRRHHDRRWRYEHERDDNGGDGWQH